MSKKTVQGFQGKQRRKRNSMYCFYLLHLHDTHYSSINRTHQKLENRKIDMLASKLPVFLWEDNRTKYDEEDMYLGLFHGSYPKRVGLSISCDNYS